MHASDVLTGRIISVNHEQQSLVIELLHPDSFSAFAPPLRAAPPARIRPPADAEPSGLIQIFIPRETAPPRALRGRIIRAWGDYEQDTGGFNASQIDFSAYPGPGDDPTGVRRRLGRRCGHGRMCGGRPCDR